jgi:phosphoketolase
MLMTSEAAARRKPLSRDELESIDLWWRTANYLSVGQIYSVPGKPRPTTPGNANGEPISSIDNVSPALLV